MVFFAQPFTGDHEILDTPLEALEFTFYGFTCCIVAHGAHYRAGPRYGQRGETADMLGPVARDDRIWLPPAGAVAISEAALSATDYTELNEAFSRAGAGTDAAECHGTICGILCIGRPTDDKVWSDILLEGLDPDSVLVAEARAMIGQLADQTQAGLRSNDMAFAPLLPDDDAPLAARAGALAQWVQGFLFGLAAGAAQRTPNYSDETREVIEDFSQIARLGAPEDGGDEDDEIAFAELVEYLRVGTQLVYEELREGKSRTAAAAAPPTVH